jgi:hypothetical protein
MDGERSGIGLMIAPRAPWRALKLAAVRDSICPSDLVPFSFLHPAHRHW